MRSEVLKALGIKLIVCWDKTPFSLMRNAVRFYDSTSSNFRLQNNL